MAQTTTARSPRTDADAQPTLIELAVCTGALARERLPAVHAAMRAGAGAITAMIEHGGVVPRVARALRDRQRQGAAPTVIDGWRITGTLGVGGMAVVLRGERPDGRRCALKLLSTSIAGDARARERLLREARAMAAVAHDNVVAILGSGDVGGRCWIALELLPGGDAAARLAACGGALPPHEAARIARDAARGLAALHAVGLLHRDIKPSNLFLDADGAAKVADLGLAKGEAPDDQLTQAGLRVGTPAYMAPEQVRCHALDARTDVYALGATLFHLATGRKPFAGTPRDMLQAIIAASAPPDPLAAAPDLPPRLAAIIRRAMHPVPARRHRSAAALARDLDEVVAGGRRWAWPRWSDVAAWLARRRGGRAAGST